jgi:hypothetical protein
MDWLTIVTIVLGSSVASSLIIWVKEIYFDRREEKKIRSKIREEAYRSLMRDVDFIYSREQPDIHEMIKKKEQFIENYRLLFLHAPDDVVRGVNEVLSVMKSSQNSDEAEMVIKKDEIATSILVLRKQFIPKTELTKEDFEHVI